MSPAAPRLSHLCTCHLEWPSLPSSPAFVQEHLFWLQRPSHLVPLLESLLQESHCLLLLPSLHTWALPHVSPLCCGGLSLW